jgi:hypothetical protein
MTQPTKYLNIAQHEMVAIAAVQTSLTKSDVSEHPITTSTFTPTFEIVKSRTTLDHRVIHQIQANPTARSASLAGRRHLSRRTFHAESESGITHRISLPRGERS